MSNWVTPAPMNIRGLLGFVTVELFPLITRWDPDASATVTLGDGCSAHTPLPMTMAEGMHNQLKITGKSHALKFFGVSLSRMLGL